MTTKLTIIIDRLLKEYTGGEPYFDKLDEVMRQSQNFDIVRELFLPLQDSNIIVSGKFGIYILELFEAGFLGLGSIVVVNGGLRSGEIVSVQGMLKNNCEYIFVDDSFYKGRTRDKVKNFLVASDCKLTKTRVIYDGSIEQDETVVSLYRYHKQT